MKLGKAPRWDARLAQSVEYAIPGSQGCEFEPHIGYKRLFKIRMLKKQTRERKKEGRKKEKEVDRLSCGCGQISRFYELKMNETACERRCHRSSAYVLCR